jgi:hypothetical protein
LTHSTKPPFLYATHGPDQLEPRKAALEWLQEVFAALMILNAGLMDEHVEDHPRSVDEQVPFAPFHFLAAVIAASPPFWLVSFSASFTGHFTQPLIPFRNLM